MRLHHLALVALFVGACNTDDKDTDTTDTTDTTDDTTDDTDGGDTDGMDTDDMMESDADIAAGIWTEIDGYESWPQSPDWTGIQFRSDGSPHDPYVQIWMNQIAFDDWADVQGGGEFSDGAILVKRVYDSSDAADVTASTYVQKKIDGYADTDWFWAVYTDDQGTAGDIGDVGMCTGCHSAGLDYSGTANKTPGTPP